jgi:hypothetical protein
MSPMIPFTMNQCSSLVHPIHGFNTLFSVSKPNAFNLKFHLMNDVALDTIQSDTLSLVTRCTIVALILSYDIT